MSRLFSLCLVFFLVMSVAHAQGIDGKWNGEMEGPNGSFPLTFNFHVVADSLTGAVESQMGDIPISNGEIDGKKFSFDVSFNQMTITHQCTVTSDSTISMKVKGMQEPMEIILKKLPESKDESK